MATPGAEVRSEAARFAAPRPGPVRVDTPGFLAWALLDRRTGELSTSDNAAEPGPALAAVRPWLAADHLRRVGQREPNSTRMRQLRAILRVGDAYAADALAHELGGPDTVRRMADVCELTDTRPEGGHWAQTRTSARDLARLGGCLADGRAAGDRWTPWLLDQLRAVRGDGDFGVRAALPGDRARAVGISNGWRQQADSRWQVTCVAIADDWVASVVTRYPGRLGLAHGKRLCRDVSGQLVAPYAG